MFPIEAFQATVNKIVAIFREHDIGFHLTGGITSIYYGEPRMTQDIDIVADNSRMGSQLESVLNALDSSDFIFDAPSIDQAIQTKGMFQRLDGVESLKLDIYPREMIPGELQRSALVEVFSGEKLPIASRADTGAAKLAWISKGSHKSRRDLRQIFRNSEEADRKTITDLADRMQLAALLKEVLAEPDEMA